MGLTIQHGRINENIGNLFDKIIQNMIYSMKKIIIYLGGLVHGDIKIYEKV